MNAKKILSKLIVIFVVLNIVLMAINGMRMINSYTLSRERVKNIKAVLEERGIVLETSLPLIFTPKTKAALNIDSATAELREQMVKELFGENQKEVAITNLMGTSEQGETIRTYTKGKESIAFERDQIIYTNGEALEGEGMLSVKEAKAKCSAFIAGFKYTRSFKKAYIECVQNEEGMTLTYYPRFEGIPVFSSYIQFEMGPGGIKKAIMHIGTIGALNSDQVKQAIYPIDMVLFGIEDELALQKPITITAITLGYHSVSATSLNLLGEKLVPAYKIQIEGLREPLFVNAYTNTRIE